MDYCLINILNIFIKNIASSVEHEMNSCLTYMKKLQAKMVELQETKNSEDLENEKKIKYIEPNMAVMKNLLDLYKTTPMVPNSPIGYAIALRFLVIQLFFFKLFYLWPPSWIFWFSYLYYCIFYLYNYVNIHGRMNIHQPSDLMKSFIESTFNLFQIQQKRIDELEAKLLTKVN